MELVFPPNCYLRFSIVVLEILKFKWQCTQYLEFNPTCAKGVGAMTERYGLKLYWEANINWAKNYLDKIKYKTI